MLFIVIDYIIYVCFWLLIWFLDNFIHSDIVIFCDIMYLFYIICICTIAKKLCKFETHLFLRNKLNFTISIKILLVCVLLLFIVIIYYELNSLLVTLLIKYLALNLTS